MPGRVQYFEMEEPSEVCILCGGNKGYYVAAVNRGTHLDLYSICAYCRAHPDVDSKIRDLKI